MNFIERFLDALMGLKPKKRTIIDDINDARKSAGLPKIVHNAKRWL